MFQGNPIKQPPYQEITADTRQYRPDKQYPKKLVATGNQRVPKALFDWAVKSNRIYKPFYCAHAKPRTKQAKNAHPKWRGKDRANPNADCKHKTVDGEIE